MTYRIRKVGKKVDKWITERRENGKEESIRKVDIKKRRGQEEEKVLEETG